MTQIVKPDVGEFGALKQRFEGSLDQISLIDGSASRVLKEQPVGLK
jgi:hypothetical protein